MPINEKAHNLPGDPQETLEGKALASSRQISCLISSWVTVEDDPEAVMRAEVGGVLVITAVVDMIEEAVDIARLGS